MFGFGESSTSASGSSGGGPTGILRPETSPHTHTRTHVLRSGHDVATGPFAATPEQAGATSIESSASSPLPARTLPEPSSSSSSNTPPAPSVIPPSPPQAPGQKKDSESMLLSVLDESGLTVWKGSLGATALGTALGAAVGVAQADPAKPPVYLATRGAKNTFVVAFPFFALRETVTIPLLKPFQTENNGWLPSTRHSTPRLSRHTYNVVPGMLTGGAIGAAVGLYYRQSAAAGSMALKFSLFCGVAQLICNEARNITGFQGLRFGPGAQPPPELVSPDAPPVPAAAPTPTPAAAGSDPMPAPASADTGASTGGEKRSWLSEINENFPWPVKRVSDEEYQVFLEKRVRELEAEMAVLDAEAREAAEDRERRA